MIEKKLYKILGTRRYQKDDGKLETWEEVFHRMSREGQIDLKVVIQVTAALLDNYDEIRQAKKG